MNDRDRVTLVLASGSPRRSDLMRAAGYEFTVRTSGVDEEIGSDLDPEALVRALALQKALAVASGLSEDIVVGADTTVAIDGIILNKPADDVDAVRMLRLLRGRTHQVWTGLAAVAGSSNVQIVSAVSSLVLMRDYSDAEIEAYVATGEPLDKAGAYAIQGGAGVFVDRIEGCYTNVVGLPMCELARMLSRFGIDAPGESCRLADGTYCPRLVRPTDESTDDVPVNLSGCATTFDTRIPT